VSERKRISKITHQDKSDLRHKFECGRERFSLRGKSEDCNLHFGRLCSHVVGKGWPEVSVQVAGESVVVFAAAKIHKL